MATPYKGGRPPLPERMRKQPICVRMRPDVIDLAYLRAMQMDKSLSQVIERAVLRYLQRTGDGPV